uniref:2Fe-2S ferredoxin-type domain-containing protein n=1 Tax=Craspedostauros australis TaxID=1486917 RepID=A0A7R9WSN6_9STRA|mmetsp:Transcript_19097/g.53042  ORF Transcript_19097/g.53042 Transcript_19097/m.53042 type:complete len:118 (+) Transcript_19097:239-592(+)|eukprot:CAMPEP_0198123118 /NCGR_PEP_ID=MMETSP1442-20131203/36722_1 /TAXON_ID= /ORGANISM="Craspedostauros australis, Strain CCMP3328" /LENGTH=117 /DNA_ID=CAMNT_0043782273 /DNA_START=231 /DNA_END=584 /DNA_ORIENTATION=-
MRSFHTTVLLVVTACLCLSQCYVEAFTAPQLPQQQQSSTTLSMTILTNGNKKKNFKPGSPLKSAVAALGVKPKYSCRKGDCGSCTVSVGGQRIKACIGKVPDEPRLKSLQEKGLPVK